MPLLMCDLDDTLVDRARHFLEWADAFCASHGLDPAVVPSLVDLDSRGNLARKPFFTTVVRRYGLTDDVPALVADWNTTFPLTYRSTPEVLAALDEARTAGWTVAIVTNGLAEVQGAKIRAAGLDEHVDVTCISSEVGVRKPDAAMFEAASVRTGVPLAGGWMIGDNPTADIGGAAALGLSTVWIGEPRDWPIHDVTPTACAPTGDVAIRLVVARGTAAAP